MNKKLLTVAGLIGVGVAGRLLPHLPNATPVTAIALAANKYVGRAWAVAIPLLAMLLSDAVIGFYDWRVLLSVYFSFAAIGLLSAMTKKHAGMFSVALVTVSSSVLFFLVTNFVVWATSPWYEKNASGLLYCYLVGLPFLRNMLLGDLVYGGILLYGAKAAHTMARFLRDIKMGRRAMRSARELL